MSSSANVQKMSVIFLKIGALLSMSGSFLIMRDVWHRFKEKKEISLTASLVFELSVFDFCSSFFGPFMATWMVPKETGAYLAAGSTATCTAQGFFNITFYSSSVLCNTSLAIAYCLIVKRGWKDRRGNSTGNWLLRGLPVLSLFLSLGPLFGDAYNFSGMTMCDIEPYPFGCSLDGSAAGVCTRGANSAHFKLTSLSALVILNLIIIASVLTLVHSVWLLEKRMTRYSVDGNANRSNTIKTTWQGIWYIAAFGLAWWPFATYYLIKTLTIHPPTFLHYLYAITWPAQGAYNAIVYFRPKYKSDRERRATDTRITALCRVLRASQINRFSINRTKRQIDDNHSSKICTDESNHVQEDGKTPVINVNVDSAIVVAV